MDKRKRRLLCMLEGSGRKSRWISGVPPLSFRAFAAGMLENYRIYGNTVDGESVGDRTGNLFEISTFRDGSTSAVIYAVTFTINNNAVSISGVSSAQYPQVTSQRFELISGERYSAKIFVDGSYDGQIYIMMNGGEQQDGSDKTNYKRINVGSGDTFVAKTYNSIIYVAEGTNKESNAIVRVMLIKGSTLPDTYEPYGYKVPITVTNSGTTSNETIYLPEQIKMVGSEAEYVDYAEQKQHRIGADDINVTLPALPTLPGTNVLSVGTAVQPSRVEVKGRIKAVGQETEPEPEAAEAEQE